MQSGNSCKFLQRKLCATNGMVMHQLLHVHVQLVVPSYSAQSKQSTVRYLHIRFGRILCFILLMVLHICAFATAMLHEIYGITDEYANERYHTYMALTAKEVLEAAEQFWGTRYDHNDAAMGPATEMRKLEGKTIKWR